MPKYLNSPETTLFNKRETLFNFDKARKEIRKENTVLLLRDSWMLSALAIRRKKWGGFNGD